ncbi:hypothetical protein LX32DRAFT_633663 [Colletotrichum zoysiae]|uniref:Uncharacterized protein n=1 Tax=Colletotrichum zoysiae TaxID=1216348 RepID=A0AAD9HUA0_9PEZI|nr:hypothetical protein LX32DRAFT_633663 [Colletotrichum zoysiae]
MQVLSFILLFVTFLPAITIVGADTQFGLDRIKGTEYFLGVTGSKKSPVFEIYGNGYERGEHPVTTFYYRQSLFKRQPILYVAARNEQDKTPRRQSLGSLIKAVTAEKTSNKLDNVPYVVFYKHELLELADRFVKYRAGRKKTSFTINAKNEKYWDMYQKTYSFKYVAETFAPRRIAEIQVSSIDERAGGFETRFVLTKKP